VLAVSVVVTYLFDDFVLRLLVHVTLSTVVWLHLCFVYTTCETVLVEYLGDVIFQRMCDRKCLDVQDGGIVLSVTHTVTGALQLHFSKVFSCL